MNGVTLNGQGSSDRLVAIVALGLVQAIRLGVVSVDEAEHQLFWPWAIEALRKQGCSKDVLAMLDQGRELEDMASLIPESLPRALNDIEASARSVLERTRAPYNQVDRWLQVGP